ncbi:MAG TPA: amidohydrolase family protein [Gaiellaceae bacterium]|nr:amidohydrolase family protein [Gaiellaceae bacterium]
MQEQPRIPGFVNAHCHAFQRALRGRTEGGDFWAWRETMLELAAAQTSESVRREYVDVYRELRAAGYTAVGEFHYLGLEEGRAAAEAAAEAGIELVLLHVAYARGGIERFRQESVAAYLRELEELRAGGIRVGVAPHSVRACPRDWLEELGRYAAEHELPLHVHADEQPREIDECLAKHDLRPIELLDACGCLGARTTVVHATHADGHELDLLAAAGARVCTCPTTEANLGDGFLPVERLLHRRIPLCIGSDSNVRIYPLEELGQYAAEHELLLHVHADEQPREIEECLAEHGLRPIELLAACGCLGPRTTVVHATHADGHELDLLAAAGASVCACPTTEANLGDGFLPVERLLHRGIDLCIGSDSNVRIDPLEELRELDGIARRQSGRRDVFAVDDLLAIGSAGGAQALGLESWPDVAVDLKHSQLAGVEDWSSALVAGCSADVLVT